MDIVLQIASVVAPIFIGAGVGYGWERLGYPFDSGFITRIVMYVGTPCLIVSTLTRFEVGASAFAEMAGAAALALLLFAAIGAVVVRALGLPLASFLPPLMFPNGGNMGLPLCLFAFGEAGLALAIAVFTVYAVIHFTVGVSFAAGTLSPARLLRTPILYAVAVALAFMASGTKPPVWLANTVDLLGGLAIPLMLIALGVSLARLRVKSLRRSLLLALVRLGMGFAVGFGLATLFGFTGIARGVLIVQCSMPTAVYNYLLAAHYGRPADEVAGIIVLSTIVSLATLPLLLLFVL
jgi:predicted permease